MRSGSEGSCHHRDLNLCGTLETVVKAHRGFLALSGRWDSHLIGTSYFLALTEASHVNLWPQFVSGL